MKAFIIQTPGKETGKLVLSEASVPEPKPHEVLIKVAYAGINRADIFQRQGSYPAPESASPFPGLEVSGSIVSLGENVKGWKIGDKVCALLSGGGYAEYAIAHSGHILPVPDGHTLEEAAALPEALITIWMALHEEANLKTGETLLVHGGASGVGMVALQYAKALGVEVYVTAGTTEKCKACTEWGAIHAINYHEQDFVEFIKQETPSGVDVVLDMVGGDYIARNFQVLKKGGRMITIAFLQSARLEHINMAPLLLKHLTWKGITLRSRSDLEKETYIRHIRQKCWGWLENKQIKPHIDRVFSFTEAEKAHQYIEENLNIGKIVLKV